MGALANPCSRMWLGVRKEDVNFIITCSCKVGKKSGPGSPVHSVSDLKDSAVGILAILALVYFLSHAMATRVFLYYAPHDSLLCLTAPVSCTPHPISSAFFALVAHCDKVHS